MGEMHEVHWPDVRAAREELGLSQKEMATFLGVSIRTVQSCEQGWRHLSPALERTLLVLLIISRRRGHLGEYVCWEEMQCQPARREQCFAFQSKQGHLCWFLTGRQCACCGCHDWKSKKSICMQCKFFRRLVGDLEQTQSSSV